MSPPRCGLRNTSRVGARGARRYPQKHPGWGGATALRGRPGDRPLSARRRSELLTERAQHLLALQERLRPVRGRGGRRLANGRGAGLNSTPRYDRASERKERREMATVEVNSELGQRIV